MDQIKNKVIIRTQGASPCLNLLDFLPNLERQFPNLEFEVTVAIREGDKIVGNKSLTGGYPCLEFRDMSADKEVCPNGQIKCILATSDYYDAVSFLLLCSSLTRGVSCTRRVA
jgi:hypothetical protein